MSCHLNKSVRELIVLAITTVPRGISVSCIPCVHVYVLLLSCSHTHKIHVHVHVNLSPFPPLSLSPSLPHPWLSSIDCRFGAELAATVQVHV